MPTLQYKLNSQIGCLYLIASDKGLQGVFRNRQNHPITKSLTRRKTASQLLAKAAKELSQYFKGKRTFFTVPLDVQGTAFQKAVWNELKKIPYGKTCSYQDIAKRINHGKAVRAVGNANGKNPVYIIVPCHRVITSDGSLGGYSGGLAMKKKLLALESESRTNSK